MSVNDEFIYVPFYGVYLKRANGRVYLSPDG